MGRKLYVGNLPYSVSEGELQELFGQVGAVASVRVMRDAATGRARGFAFVEMASDEDAQKAVTQLDQKQFGGRTIAVNEARPMTPRTGESYRGPDYRGGGGPDSAFDPRGKRREPRW